MSPYLDKTFFTPVVDKRVPIACIYLMNQIFIQQPNGSVNIKPYLVYKSRDLDTNIRQYISQEEMIEYWKDPKGVMIIDENKNFLRMNEAGYKVLNDFLDQKIAAECSRTSDVEEN
jgi:hypothetical protein